MDLVYLDPPYNQHPYGSNYFMLNLLVEYKEPREVSRVSGIPLGWNRSVYNRRRSAEDSLFGLIDDCDARFVLISYNSEGFIPKESFETKLGKMGNVKSWAIAYNTFRGCRNLRNREQYVTEYLYLLEKGARA